MRSHMRLWVSAFIIALVILIGFVLSVPHTRRDISQTVVSIEPPAAAQVSVHDVFKKGVHTITGSLEAPNACTLVTVDASVIDTGSIIVSVSMPEDIGICLQLPTTVKFSVTASAPADVPITVLVNGREASTTPI